MVHRAGAFHRNILQTFVNREGGERGNNTFFSFGGRAKVSSLPFHGESRVARRRSLAEARVNIVDIRTRSSHTRDSAREQRDAFSRIPDFDV